MIVIPEPLVGELSLSTAKPITHGRHGRRVSCFPSRKNRTGVMCDSLLESDFCLELERQRSVRQYISQPFRITHHKSQTSYVPDFEVLFNNNQTVLFEVKSEKRYNNRKSPGKLELFSCIFRECGYSLQIALDLEIRQGFRTENLRSLYHQSFSVTESESDRFRTELNKSSLQEFPISSLLAADTEPKMIAYGLFYELLITDLNRPLTIDTIVRLETTNERFNERQQ